MHLGHYGIEVTFKQEGPLLRFSGEELTINEPEFNRVAAQNSLTPDKFLDLILQASVITAEERNAMVQIVKALKDGTVTRDEIREAIHGNDT